ncbi:MAG: hypothetical protein H6719_29160 [Sandaracinaceae bacterium]|nr:hypothetical protein [Sandaracinaceae bacterium]
MARSDGLYLSAESILFGETAVDSTITRSMTVRCVGKGTARVQLAATGSFGLASDAPVNIKGGSVLTRQIQFSPTSTGLHEGTFTATVLDSGDQPTSYSASCALRGLGVANPWVDNSVTEVDFGVTAVGADEVGVIVVKVPQGYGTTTITPSVSGDDASAFTLSVGSTSVDGGRALTIIVTFTPSAERTYGASLDLTYGSPAVSLPSVSLLGEGVTDDEAEATADATAYASSTATSASTKQRVSFYVPFGKSVVNLGSKLSQNGATLTHAGFTAATTGHVLFRAAGVTTVQAHGHVWFQSNTGSLLALAGQHARLIAGKQVVIGAEDMIGVSAGFVGRPADPHKGDAEPGETAGVSDMGAGFLGADVTFGLVSLLIKVANRYKDIHEYYGLDKYNEEGMHGMIPFLPKWFVNWSRFWAFNLFSLYSGVAFIADRAAGLPSYSLTMTAPAGVLSGTPSVSLHTATSTVTYSSLNTTVMGIAGVSLESGWSTLLDSVWGQTQIHAGNQLVIVSSLKSYFWSRQDRLAFYGANIRLGKLGAPVGNQKKDCITTEINATGSVRFESGGAVSIDTREIRQGVIGFAKNATAEVTAGNEILLKVEGFDVLMSKSGVSIAEKGETVVELTPTQIVLGSATAPVTITGKDVDVGTGVVNIGAAGIAIRGQIVDLL